MTGRTKFKEQNKMACRGLIIASINRFSLSSAIEQMSYFRFQLERPDTLSNLRHCLSFLGLTFLLVACGNPLGGSASLVSTGHDPGQPDAASGTATLFAEPVSSSVQIHVTNGARFVVEWSLSSPTNQVMQNTNSRGYKLFSNIQGVIVSNGEGL